ncbi:MAG: hypothetical protein R6V34_05440 [Bacteroidales bacterium]
MKYLIHSLFICCFLLGTVNQVASGQQDWAALHNKLHRKIEKDYHQPPDSERIPEVWYSWIDQKGEDRNKVLEILNQLNTLHNSNPDNEIYSSWVQKFYELLEYAEQSGTYTVNGASIKFIYIDKYSNWENTYRTVNNYGREIYSRAKANSFNTYNPYERSRCLINFSIGDLESNKTGGSLYADRDLRFGYLDDEGYMNLPDRNFEVVCERRGEFERFSEGRPRMTIDWAITSVDLLRDECNWWKFTGERQDATDLLNEYYEDALCKNPPHKQKLGHKYFRDLIKETDGTEKSVEYNKGFYGTLYGKVEIEEFGVLKPASGAEVVVNDYDETWTVTTDNEGNYEIQDVILHKDCSPFKISAVHEGERVDDTYEGPLEEPDKTYRHKKDLIIIPEHEYNWFGEISVEYRSLMDCERDTTIRTAKRLIQENKEVRQTAKFTFMVKNDGGDYRAVKQFIMDDMSASGTISGSHSYEYKLNMSSKDSRIREHQKTNGYGNYDADQNDLVLQIFSKEIIDNASRYKQMVEDIMKNGFDPEAIEKANKEVDRTLEGGEGETFPVKVIVQIPVTQTGKCYFKDYRSSWSESEGQVTEKNESDFRDMPIITPVEVEMEGNYIKGENGTDRIEASYSKTEPVPNTKKGCPPVQKSLSASFTMQMKKIK